MYTTLPAAAPQSEGAPTLGQRDEAAALWDRLLAGPEPFPATKVLYARLLAEDPATADRARGLTMEILEAASTPSPAVGISVVLAAVENLGKRHLRQWLPDASARFGDLIADSIVTATVRGLEQGFIAFVAVGRYWGFYEPNRFLEVFRQIPAAHGRPIPVRSRA